MAGPSGSGAERPHRVFISYAIDQADPGHPALVRHLWEFLRSCGIDARFDRSAEQRRQDWAQWMAQQIREADHVLVIASPAYRDRAEGRSGPDDGRGVQWEARLIRNAFYADQHALDRFVPVVLPGYGIEDIPDFLAPATSTVYHVSAFTVAGADALLRFLTDQPEVIEPPLGPVPRLGPSAAPPIPSTHGDVTRYPAPGVRNVISGNVTGTVIQAESLGAVTITGSGPPQWGPSVGMGGDPGIRRAFEEAFHRAGGAGRLGHPTTVVLADGPGHIQHFAGPGGDSVICARAGQPAVAVAGPVWTDVSMLPGMPVPGVASAGYPVAGAPLADYIPAHATAVELDGGSWGSGVLLRSGRVRWQPHPRMTMDARLANQSPPTRQADVTVRAIATLSWDLDDAEWEITDRTRQRLAGLLADAEITGVIPLLSRRRGAVVTAPAWVRRPGAFVLYAPDGGLAATTVVRLHAPTGVRRPVTVFVESHVDLTPWRPGDARMTAGEIVHLWAVAWDTATMVVPRALVDDPPTVPLLEPPRVELHLKANVDTLDLSAFGEHDGDPSREGAATIIAPVGFGRQDRWQWAARTLTRLARDWGFADAAESDVDPIA